MSNDTTELPAEDARRLRILDGARQAFLAYGFQRTTMDDIARAAQISRPALYLMFRNKSDIYRALAQEFVEEMLAAAREALSIEGSLAARLERVFMCVVAMTVEMEASPHGAEILDMKNNLAGDIVAEWRGRMAGLVKAAIETETAKRAPGAAPAPSSSVLADMLLDAMEGMKMRRLPPQEQREAASAFVRIIAGAAAH